MAGNDINELKRRMQGALNVLKTELNGLRTGRASAHLLDPIHVEAYGQTMALNQLATVSIPQPHLNCSPTVTLRKAPSAGQQTPASSTL